MLAKHWRHLAKKEAKAAKAAKDAGTQHIPAAENPEATFIPLMLADFLKVGMPDILSRVPLLINLHLPSLGKISCNQSAKASQPLIHVFFCKTWQSLL